MAWIVQVFHQSTRAEQTVILAIGYLLSCPDGGGIGPRQRPVIVVTGLSWLCHHTVNSPFVRQTSTILS